MIAFKKCIVKTGRFVCGNSVSYFGVSVQIGKSYVLSKLKDYPRFCSVAIAINKSGFKVCLFLYDL